MARKGGRKKMSKKGARSGCAGCKSPGHATSTRKAAGKKFYRG